MLLDKKLTFFIKKFPQIVIDGKKNGSIRPVSQFSLQSTWREISLRTVEKLINRVLKICRL